MHTEDLRYKLILTYDLQADWQDRYFEFMLGEMVPAVQSLGLQMTGAWHTAYGTYPARLVEFVAEDHTALADALETRLFTDMERRLRRYVTNYRKKVVRLREDQFQF